MNEKESIESIEDYEWFWGDIPPDDVDILMVGLPNGYFLLRNSASKEADKYTLVVRYNDTNIRFSVTKINNLYDIRSPNRFNTIIALIIYYTENSFREVHSEINLKLMQPLTKNDALTCDWLSDLNDNQLVDQLQTDQSTQEEREKIIDGLFEKLKEEEQKRDNVIKKKRGIEILESWCSDQLDKQGQYLVKHVVKKEYLESQKRNLVSLNTRISNYRKLIDECETNLTQLNASVKSIQSSINTQMAIADHLSKREKCITNLFNQRGVEFDVIYNENQEDIDKLFKQLKENLSKKPINDKKFWYRNISSSESLKLLEKCQDGSFLIRPSSQSTSFTFALDIVVNNEVKRCGIYKSGDSYGFKPNRLSFTSLEELVNTYHYKSLHKLNTVLNTKLLYPVGIINTSNHN